MQLVQKPIKKIIKEVAIELDLPIEVVTDIYYSQFKFVAVEMAKGVKGEESTFSNILLKYLGTFYASKPKIFYSSKARLKTLDITNEEHSRTI
jgi:hypothetical protein